MSHHLRAISPEPPRRGTVCRRSPSKAGITTQEATKRNRLRAQGPSRRQAQARARAGPASCSSPWWPSSSGPAGGARADPQPTVNRLATPRLPPGYPRGTDPLPTPGRGQVKARLRPGEGWLRPGEGWLRGGASAAGGRFSAPHGVPLAGNFTAHPRGRGTRCILLRLRLSREGGQGGRPGALEVGRGGGRGPLQTACRLVPRPGGSRASEANNASAPPCSPPSSCPRHGGHELATPRRNRRRRRQRRHRHPLPGLRPPFA